METERKIVLDNAVSFETDSVEKYRLAAMFMAVVAENCFEIELPVQVVECWRATLELMYYADHVLDHVGEANDKLNFSLHCIECMFADPLDWEYLKFGEPNMDRSLDNFRINFVRTSGVDGELSETAYEIFEHSERLKEQTEIDGVVETRVTEAERCAELLLQIGNNPVSAEGRENYGDWLRKFWRFGNMADLIIDFRDDYENGIVRTPNDRKNYLVLIKAAVAEFVGLAKFNNPWLIKNYIRAGYYLMMDKEACTENS